MHVGNVPNIISLSSPVVYCTIFCKVHCDMFDEEWLDYLELVQLEDSTSSAATQDGGTVRDLLANYFISD